jgi:hypothetical protein
MPRSSPRVITYSLRPHPFGISHPAQAEGKQPLKVPAAKVNGCGFHAAAVLRMDPPYRNCPACRRTAEPPGNFTANARYAPEKSVAAAQHECCANRVEA